MEDDHHNQNNYNEQDDGRDEELDDDDEDEEETDALEMNINTYQDQNEDIKSLRKKKRKSGARTDFDCKYTQSN